MATENPQESSPLENEELPTPQFSDKGDSSTSTDADAIVSKLTPLLEQIVERKVQSVKDKRFSEIEKALGGCDKMLAELESEGVSIPKEVRTQMQIRELQERLAQQSPQPAPASVDGSTQQKAAVTEAIAKLQQYGLSENDPGFIELLRGKYASKTEFDNKVLGHIVGKLAPQKPANPADFVPGPATGSANTGSDTAAKVARLQELYKLPTKHKAEIKALEKELEARGWK